MTYAFRVDSSTRIGTGHLVRCLTLANRFKSRGEESIFLCQHLDGEMTSQVESAGFEVLHIDSNKADQKSLESRDAFETLRLLGKRSASRIVVDHYDLSLEWEESVTPHVDSVVVIDDLTDRQHRCDLLLNQNLVHSNDLSNSRKFTGASRTLLGPKFALLQPEYALFRTARPTGSSRVGSISVFMGGSDPDNVTELVVRSLVGMELVDVNVDVVVGNVNPNHARLRSMFENQPSINFHTNLSSLAPLLAMSDIAIGAGGTSNWERMCIGVPPIVIDIADNQRQICVDLAKAGLIEHIGSSDSISTADIQDAVQRFLTQSGLRRQYSLQGQITVDGLGADRVTEALLPSDQTSLTLRTCQVEDVTLYFNWVNDAAVRQSSLTSGSIGWTEHKDWFLSHVNSRNSAMYVICAENLPIGQVRFDKCDDIWTIDYSLDEFIRGRGWGNAVVKLGLAELRKVTTGKVIANVKESNTPSRRIFEQLGFSATALSSDTVAQYALVI